MPIMLHSNIAQAPMAERYLTGTDFRNGAGRASFTTLFLTLPANLDNATTNITPGAFV